MLQQSFFYPPCGMLQQSFFYPPCGMLQQFFFLILPVGCCNNPFFILPVGCCNTKGPLFLQLVEHTVLAGGFFLSCDLLKGHFVTGRYFLIYLLYKRECPEGAMQTIDILFTKKSSYPRIKDMSYWNTRLNGCFHCILLGPPGRAQAFPNLRPGLLNCWHGTERVKITRESNLSQDQQSVPHNPGEW